MPAVGTAVPSDPTETPTIMPLHPPLPTTAGPDEGLALPAPSPEAASPDAASNARPAIVALIPAHDEAGSIAASLASVLPQVDRAVVITDNCTDDTGAIAAAVGAEVMATQGNADKKAGALNQALRYRFRRRGDRRRASHPVAEERRRGDRRAAGSPVDDECDAVLVMDADSILDDGWVRVAGVELARDPRLGGVGGVFRGGPGGGFVGMLQRNEYARYARDVARLKGRALVLTGTSSLLPLRVVREVVAARRDGRLPYGSGELYDTKVLTEDNELSLAIMHLGYRIASPKDCTLVTEVMPTWRALAQQRLRWKRGAVENLLDYGLTPVTWRYWLRQVWTATGIAITFAYLASLVWGLLVVGSLALYPIWLTVTAVFIAERVITVRARGWRQMLLAAPLVIEMAFDVFLQAVQARAYAEALLRLERRW